MALLAELTIDSDGTQFVKAINSPGHQMNRFTYIAYGTFGGASIDLVLSPDRTIEIANIQNGSAVSFNAARSDNFDVNSDNGTPLFIGFKASSTSGTTDITVRVYDVFPG